ncbi:MAG: hypothetical protein DRG30_10295 [Epsilonproteobacteria bacterium]|nr:MAG: hypothetical protein DRG30_10295 [Campylobacterota bacterium]
MKLIIATLMATLLLADFTMVYEMDSGADGKIEEIIQYKNAKHIKLSYRIVGEKISSKDTGQYIVDGIRYTVLEEDGKLTYMNMDKIDKATNKLTQELNVSKAEELDPRDEKPFFTILKKHPAKIISGMNGEVWEVESEEDGRKYKEKIIVTNDQKVVEAMRITLKILNSFGEGPYGMEIDNDLETMLLLSDTHALLYAEGMVFKSLNHNTIDDTVFLLPKGAVNSMKNLPKMDEKSKSAGKELLKNMLE